jgi:hypothetical protein
MVFSSDVESDHQNEILTYLHMGTNIVIITIIIIGRTALFEPYPSLEDSVRLDDPGFTSLDFAAIIFLQSKVVSLVSNPQSRGPGLCIYVRQ